MKKRTIVYGILSIMMPLAAFAQTYKYEPAVVTLHGKLMSAQGETPNGKKITYPALQLAKPITVQGDGDTPTEKGVALMHMVLNPKMMEAFKNMKGKEFFILTMGITRPMC